MQKDMIRDMFGCIPEIDFEAGCRYFLSNMDNYSKALMSILKSIKSKLPLLKLMHITLEYEGLRSITQTLGIMLKHVGAVELAEESYQLEVALWNNDRAFLTDHLWAYITELTEFTQHLEILLRKFDTKTALLEKEKGNSFLNRDFTKTRESIRLSKDYIGRKII